MARGRFISKSISTSKKFNSDLPGKCPNRPDSEFAQMLYLMLIPHTDDFGRMPGDGTSVKLSIIPGSSRNVQDVESALLLLHRVDLVTLYRTENSMFLQVTDFDAHQVGLHKRTASRYPNPPKVAQTDRENGIIPGSSGKIPVEVEVEVEVEEKKKKKKKGIPEDSGKIPESPPGIVPESQECVFFGNVKLTKEQHENLVTRFGQDKTDRIIVKLSTYKKAHGREYDSDFDAIALWVVSAVEAEDATGQPGDLNVNVSRLKSMAAERGIEAR
jgi:hypothetical protein